MAKPDHVSRIQKAPKLPRKRRHRVASIKSTKTKPIPRTWAQNPKNSSPIDLEADENVHVACVSKDTDGYGDAVLVFTVTNNTGVDMMFGDVDSYAYVNGVIRDVHMHQPVAAGEETRAMLTFAGTYDDPDFDVNNDLNDIYLNIWMFEEQTGNVYFKDLVHIP